MFAVASCCSLIKLLCLSARSLLRLNAGVTPTSTETRDGSFSSLIFPLTTFRLSYNARIVSGRRRDSYSRPIPFNYFERFAIITKEEIRNLLRSELVRVNRLGHLYSPCSCHWAELRQGVLENFESYSIRHRHRADSNSRCCSGS